MTAGRGDADVFRRQRWTGFLAVLVGGPFGLALVAGGLSDGVPLVVVTGAALLAWAAYGGKLVVNRTPALVVDGQGLTHGPSGVELRWQNIAAIRPTVRWHRGVFRMRRLELDLRDGRTPSILLNQVASDPNEVIEAVERRSGRRIEGRFTFTGVR